jgi:ubiquinone/menaquinone biosynthesis C-methylase UbiE
MGIRKGKRLDYSVADVAEVYSGPGAALWEMLMGEQIHVGGPGETTILADKAGIKSNSQVLDVCSAVGGPARQLARAYGCKVVGLDATQKMINEAVERTAKEGLEPKVEFRLGSALDMPFKAATFDVVWGQDAWCYVTDKARLLAEAKRALKPGGIIAFTDWMQTGNVTDSEWEGLNGFMAFPYMETLDGYAEELKRLGFTILETEDVSQDFARHCHQYYERLGSELRKPVVDQFGESLYEAVKAGLRNWVDAADTGKVGRARVIARKHQTTPT